MNPLFDYANNISQTVVHKELWNMRTNITPTTESCWCYCRKNMFLWLIWVHWRPTHPEYSHTRFVFFAPNWYTLPRTAVTCDSGVATKSLRLCLQWDYCPSWLEGTSFQLMHFSLRMVILLWMRRHRKHSLSNPAVSLVSSSSFIYRFLSESYICASTLIHLVLLLYLIHLATSPVLSSKRLIFSEATHKSVRHAWLWTGLH